MPGNPDRRDVLRAAAGLPLATVLPTVLGEDAVGRALAIEPLSGRPTTRPADPDASSVFPQGVASGDPTPSGAVLWTRIDPGAASANAPLRLEVVATAGLERLAGRWAVRTDRLSERDHTVKVDLDGRLDPDTAYYYRFVHDGVAGPVGRFRTLPAPDSSPDSVRFAVVTCQDYRNGYYGAFDHVARADVDYLLHLGDAIYEHGGGSDYDGRDLELPSGRAIASGLEDFRYLYRTYRSDPLFQEALAAHALIATWDDHEIVNDRFWDYEAGRPSGDHPRADDAAFMIQLFADGIRAWWEYTPVRVRYDPDADHLHDRLRLWRRFGFGDLLDLVVTDERLFRSRPDGEQGGDPPAGPPGEVELEHTMLGAAQREWFADAVTDHRTTWTAWANEVLNMGMETEYGGRRLFSNADAWDGYETERRLLMRHFREAGVSNLIALTGDLHTALAGYLHEDYGGRPARADRLGVELMTPAVTSANLAETADLPDSAFAASLLESAVLDANPHMVFFDSFHHGYATVSFTPDACEYAAYAVDKSVDAATADRERLAAFRVPAGDPVLRRQ